MTFNPKKRIQRNRKMISNNYMNRSINQKNRFKKKID